MADLKPLGSEKLQGDEKIKRILELTYYNPNKSEKQTVNAEYLSESINGVYGIVKEKDGYYVKKGLNESSLDYIGGMFMKNKNRFHSYKEALKRLELLKGQERLLQEDTKYMLKVNKGNPASAPSPADEAIPAEPVPTDDVAGLPPDAGMTDPSAEPNPEDMGTDTPDMDGEDEGGDYLKSIQKLTGKLGEKLRDNMDQMESDDLKYVLNSVISAIDLNKLDDSDKEEVSAQLDGDEDMGDEDMGDEETPNMEMPPPTGNETEMGEIDALEELINTPLDLSDDGSKPYDEVDEIDEPDGKKTYSGAMKNTLDYDPGLTTDPNDPDIPDDSDVEDVPDPKSIEDDDTGEICTNCKGRGIVGNGKECPVCNGEGVVFDNDTAVNDLDSGFSYSAEDLYDDDPGYDPIEMGEESGVEGEFANSDHWLDLSDEDLYDIKEWFRSNGGVDSSPEDLSNQVIQQYPQLSDKTDSVISYLNYLISTNNSGGNSDEGYQKYLDYDEKDFNSLTDPEKEEFFTLWKKYRKGINEVAEEYTGEEVFDGPDSADVQMREIELNELTNMIHNTVKEKLGKYFE